MLPEHQSLAYHLKRNILKDQLRELISEQPLPSQTMPVSEYLSPYLADDSDPPVQSLSGLIETTGRFTLDCCCLRVAAL